MVKAQRTTGQQPSTTAKYILASFWASLLLTSLLISGCETVTTETNEAMPSEKATDSILDGRLKRYREEVAEYPKRHELHYLIAGIHFQKREYKDCVRALYKALDVSPRESKYHYHMGRAYLQMGELEQAEEHFRESTRFVSQDRYTGPHAALGYTLARRGEMDAAIEQFETCVSIEPENPTFYYLLGSLYDIRGQDDKVIHYYREYLVRGGRQYRTKALRILDQLGVDVEGLPTRDSQFDEELFQNPPSERATGGLETAPAKAGD